MKAKGILLSMYVNEIFASIDGEGIRAGELATFVRLAGCNLRCSYCDTKYALRGMDGDSMSIDDIVKKVDEIGYRNVTLTGGEPLVHKEAKELVERLVSRGYYVNIETNGSIDIRDFQMDGVLITADYKCPSSGENARNYLENIRNLRENDVLKFVVGKTDLADVKRVLRSFKPKCYAYLSPVFGEIEPSKLVEFMKECFTDNAINTVKMRVQIQLHKYIWNPDQRGV